jgi:hypothetical protein
MVIVEHKQFSKNHIYITIMIYARKSVLFNALPQMTCKIFSRERQDQALRNVMGGGQTAVQTNLLSIMVDILLGL